MTSPSHFPCNKADLRLPGPAGDLEAITTCPPEDKALPVTTVICHPHPLHGGSMQNKVVHTLARAYADLGARTLRFNFRGVGASDGQFANALGEVEDLVAILRWVQTVRPQDQLWLAGFSFGSYVAWRAAAEFPLAHLCLVAPPVSVYDFNQPPVTCPLLVIQGDKDEVVPATAVAAWAQARQEKLVFVPLAEVDHFFHRRLSDLRAVLERELSPYIPRT